MRLLDLLGRLRARVYAGEEAADRALARAGAWLRRRWPPRPGELVVAGFVLLVAGIGALDYATLPPPLPDYATTRAAFRPSEAWLYDRDGTLIDSMRVDFAARRLAWVPLDRIAAPVRDTVVAAEDHRFWRHGGIDWLGTLGALRDGLSGRHRRGASTLEMQLAGFLDPALARPGARGWLDKLRQMRAAATIAGHWSKDQVLEAYLNLAGYRGENQGIGAAALALFGKTPDALGRDDALLLAALLPQPRAGVDAVSKRACALEARSSTSRGPTGEGVGARNGNRGGANSKPFVPSDVERRTASDCNRFEAQAAAMLGPARSLALDPGLAPHLAAKLLTRPGQRVVTTLDARIQRLAAAALRQELAGLGANRARDGAVVVVDNASGDVLGYVGGIGGASTAPQVDGADSYRQAGSTLKPFLYAEAFQKGYLTPASILDDSPVQLDTASGLYVPQDYDKGFHGPVSARSALAASLNVPAVRALLLVGVEAFRDRLWDTGYHGLVEDGDYYGYSLALGSAEVTLLEQAAAYRSLALGGRWAPLRLVPGDPPVAPRATTTPQAAFLVGSILADANARAVTFGLDSALRLPFWAAVKTGTSKAMRDNWCIGFSDRYTVAVWVGNAEGDPMKIVSGTSGAAPVWRDVMIALHAGRPGTAPAPPPGVEGRTIRFAGGLEAPRREWFLAGTGQSVIADAPGAARRPRIVSPVSGSLYAVDPDIPAGHQRLAVQIAGDAAAHRLRLDRQDLGPADGTPLIAPSPGAHRLLLVDVSGRVVDQVLFTVR